MSRRIKIIFTLSLLLNLVLIGVGAGAYHKMSRFWWGGKDMRPEVSASTQQVIRTNFRQAWEDMKPLVEQARQKREAVETIIAADVFDAAAYDAAVQDLLRQRAEISALKAQNTKNFLSQIPAEDRKKMAGHLARRLEGRGHPGHGDKKSREEWKKRWEGKTPEEQAQ